LLHEKQVAYNGAIDLDVGHIGIEPGSPFNKP